MRYLAPMLLLLVVLAAPATAAGIDDFAPRLHDVNVSARADLPGFKGQLSTTFGVPVPRIDKLIVELGSPADAYFCLKVGHLSGRPYDVVAREYKANRGQGWGVVAKNLGIKPGSAAFHELKDTSRFKKQHTHKEKNQNKSKNMNKGKGKNK